MVVFKKGEKIEDVISDLATRAPNARVGDITVSGGSVDIDIANFQNLSAVGQANVTSILEERGYAAPTKTDTEQGKQRALVRKLASQDLTLEEINDFLRSSFTITKPVAAAPGGSE